MHLILIIFLQAARKAPGGRGGGQTEDESCVVIGKMASRQVGWHAKDIADGCRMQQCTGQETRCHPSSRRLD